MPELRPMLPADVPAAHEIAVAAFEDLARRQHLPVLPRPPIAGAYRRMERMLEADPGGAWAAEEGGELAGVALALRRGRLWGLSLLVVRPDAQSGGLGRALLERALRNGEDAAGGIILSSEDPRALRAYARAGFVMHPAAEAAGTPRDVRADRAVRRFEPHDHALAAAVDGAVRGAPHGADLDALADAGLELLVLPDGGYVAHLEGAVKLLAAFDEAAAAVLLRAVLARVPPGGRASVEWLTGAQAWAVAVAVEARLELRTGGALFLRGDVGPFRPYLPSGAYL